MGMKKHLDSSFWINNKKININNSMATILLDWLNNDINISKRITEVNITDLFSNGYLLGEILSKYGLQEDFDSFSRGQSSGSKLNNFSRLGPVFQLIGVPFDFLIVESLMKGDEGVATRILYQLFIALKKKEKMRLTEFALEAQRPKGKANFDKCLHEIHHHIIRQRTKNQAHFLLDQEAQRYRDKIKAIQAQNFLDAFREQEKIAGEKQKTRHELIEHRQETKRKTDDLVAKIRAEEITIAKKQPIPVEKKGHSKKLVKKIEEFEKMLDQRVEMTDEIDLINAVTYDCSRDNLERLLSRYTVDGGSTEYFNQIRVRLNEERNAKIERDKRRRKVLVDQIKSQMLLAEQQREESLITEMMRQSQQERRFVNQLLQIRREKEVILENRLIHEEENERRRVKDMEAALNREAEMVAMENNVNRLKREQEWSLHRQIMAEKSAQKHKKHGNLCREVVSLIVDYTLKYIEYKEVTNNEIPASVIREMNELFIKGRAFFDEDHERVQCCPEVREILTNMSIREYINLNGTWAKSPELLTQPNNKVLINLLRRLLDMKPAQIVLPDYISQIPKEKIFCVVGKPFSGKTTTSKLLADEFGCVVIDIDELIQQAADPKVETESVDQTAEDEQNVKPDSTIKKSIVEGETLSDELVISLIDSRLRTIGLENGVLFDGFPRSLKQSMLLEELLTGRSVTEKYENEYEIVTGLDHCEAVPSSKSAIEHVVHLKVDDEMIRTKIMEGEGRATASARLVNFSKNWSRLEKWYINAGNLINVDEGSHQALEIINKLKQQKIDEEIRREEEKRMIEAELREKEALANQEEEVVVDKPVKGSKKSPAKQAKTPEKQKGRTSKEKGKKAKSKSSSVKDEGDTPEVTPQDLTWVFVDRPIPQEEEKILSNQWKNIKETYRECLVKILEEIQQKRQSQLEYIHGLKNQFMTFLMRPDEKEDYFLQWQKDFASIPTDLRDDEETKTELHLRVEELKHRLWDISSRQKEIAEEELSLMFSNEWLEDQIGLQDNFCISLQQAEIDKFQDLARLMKNYYISLGGKDMEQAEEQRTRLPIVELYRDEDESTTSKSLISEGKPEGQKKQSRTPRKSADVKSRKSVKESNFQPVQSFIDTETRIPLVPRKTPAMQDSATKKRQDRKSLSASDFYLSTLSNVRPDQTYCLESAQTCMEMINSIVDKAEKKFSQQFLNEDKSANDSQKAKKGKGSPGNKKSKKRVDSVPQLDTVDNKITAEFMSGIKKEAANVGDRIRSVTASCLEMASVLRSRVQSLQTRLGDVIRRTFLREMKSIEETVKIIADHVEQGQTLKNVLVISEGSVYSEMNFYIPSPPKPQVRGYSGSLSSLSSQTEFSFNQLWNLYYQLEVISPSGVIFSKTLVNLISTITTNGNCQELFPAVWMDMSYSEIQEIVSKIQVDDEFANWKKLIIFCLEPFPYPTFQQLMETLGEFREMDELSSGVVTWEQFERCGLWFSNIKPADGIKNVDGLWESRMRKLIFRVFQMEGPFLDYIDMLLYFCPNENPYDGFLRALSVVSNQEIGRNHPRLSNSSIRGQFREYISSDTESENIVGSVPEITISEIHKVLMHGKSETKSNNRFEEIESSNEMNILSKLNTVYWDLNVPENGVLPYSVIIEHPIIQDLIMSAKIFKYNNICEILKPKVCPKSSTINEDPVNEDL